MAKRARIRDIEKWAQDYWSFNRTFEQNAPALDYSQTNYDLDNRKKYFVTFPYPYMNGRIHLGHTFTITKAEFAASYQRLLGKKSLYPMGFHCTGMPISTSADKLKNEIKNYGFPPDLEALRAELKRKEEEKAKSGNEPKIVDKSKSKKSKAAAKQGTGTQWEIMKEGFGLSDDEVKQFTDPQHWIDYFPPHAINDLSMMGLKADWRRSFITTDRNPYYDSFVRWQFKNLKKNNRIARGMRNSIFSPKDGQPCMDHDRAKGEGVGPQEYVLIKMKLIEDIGFNKPTFLVAGTLRAETMYGQTNCWISPTIKYVAVETRKGEVWICTKNAARNMSWQHKLQGEPGEFKILKEIEGVELFGKALKAPLTKYDKVYALPMMTIKEDMGTGVVTSCPSDSPMDYAALMDLKNKEALREKYDISEDMVLPYEPVPIIDVPGLGDLCAPTICAQKKISSQNDSVKLAEAKEVCYLKGFYEGVMKIGKYSGKKVEDAKALVKNDLVASGEADIFHMPEKQVVSRSNDICVVALCDQWYLNYGDKEWKKDTLEALDRCNTYCDETRKNFIYTINWLNEHACSRSYGLGSRLPWDEEWLIESLSDSTIYMAYYTCCHLLHGDLDGQDRPIVQPNLIDDAFWNYVFHDSSLTNPPGIDESKVPNDVMQKARAEFLYWYGVDMRVSGKDLVRNHLSYYLFNHVSTFPNTKQFQPQTIRANGHLLLNGEKMSKSTGNFLTLTEAIELFSADGMRLALADAGDGVDDANFEEDNANAAVQKNLKN